MKVRAVRLMVLLLAMALTAACSKAKTAEANTSTDVQPSAQSAAQTKAAPVAVPSGPLPHVNGARAFQYTKDVVAFGARFVTSPGHKKTEAFLRAHLKNDGLVEDHFTADTPGGKLPMTNFIAKFPGTKPGIIVIAGHYDTLYNRNDFVGANDGGSSTGLLLELADQLRGAKREGYSVWLVWLDGEEAIQHWTANDSVYGSRQLAQEWQQDGTLKQVKAFLLLDMIGDADLDILRDQNSAQWLEDLVYDAARQFGYQSHFFQIESAIEDDHLPFAKRGVPVADLIDFTYGYNNAFWHTKEDTMDKLSPNSFEIVGNVVLETVRLLDQR
jgi:Zn-dependent M28 family amino/carboxypeptidase